MLTNHIENHEDPFADINSSNDDETTTEPETESEPEAEHPANPAVYPIPEQPRLSEFVSLSAEEMAEKIQEAAGLPEPSLEFQNDVEAFKAKAAQKRKGSKVIA